MVVTKNLPPAGEKRVGMERNVAKIGRESRKALAKVKNWLNFNYLKLKI